MELIFENHNEKYAIEQIMLMLFPDERPSYPEVPSGPRWARVRYFQGKSMFSAVTFLTLDGEEYQGCARVCFQPMDGEVELQRKRRHILRQSFYRAGVKALGSKPPWGSLSGVRPVKLIRGLMDQGLSTHRALTRFCEYYDVQTDRGVLALDAARAAREVQSELFAHNVCLYVGIPFCPTRCAYCSFVSQSVEKSMSLIEPYTEALLKEIAATGAAARCAGARPRSLYLGGGTPTTLNPEQLERVFEALEDAFDLEYCGEITVEAGRPDTITAEKLAVLREHGVTRVSVNPQTMEDRVLKAIGRRHTAADVLRALELVRAAGSFHVNMDLIAGLPEDSVEGFRRTLNQVLALNVENVTVHTLSLKKGSRITLEGTRLPDAAEVGEMLKEAEESLRGHGYHPYYLYRQKFMSGGFENVGWCQPGMESLYNICIMEELCSVLAMGAGGSTKLLDGSGGISRSIAPKYPAEYIAGIDRICAEKQGIAEVAL